MCICDFTDWIYVLNVGVDLQIIGAAPQWQSL